MPKSNRNGKVNSQRATPSKLFQSNSPESHTSSQSRITVHRDGEKVIVSIPVRFYRRNGRQMILASGAETESSPSEVPLPNTALLSALAKAYSWQDQLESGEFEDLDDLAKSNGVDRSYVGRIIQLTSLAPDIVESILAGETFANISLRHCRKGIPVLWEEQRRDLAS